MIRHGESEWNSLNRFCGWFDAGLSEKGVAEAEAAGKALKGMGYSFDQVWIVVFFFGILSLLLNIYFFSAQAHTSVLQRAQKTLGAILEQVWFFFKKNIYFLQKNIKCPPPDRPDGPPRVQDLAFERAPLRRAHGAKQGRDGREARGGAGPDLVLTKLSISREVYYW